MLLFLLYSGHFLFFITVICCLQNPEGSETKAHRRPLVCAPHCLFYQRAVKSHPLSSPRHHKDSIWFRQSTGDSEILCRWTDSDSEDCALPPSLVEAKTDGAITPLTLHLHGNNFTYMWRCLVWWNTIRVSGERYFTLKPDASRTLETSVPNHQTTWRHTSENYRLEIITEVNIKIAGSCNATPWSLVDSCQHFEKTLRLKLEMIPPKRLCLSMKLQSVTSQKTLILI
jgi:hypothetical protein